MAIYTIFRHLMHDKCVLYDLLEQFWRVETNFWGQGVQKTRKNGHFYVFYAVLGLLNPYIVAFCFFFILKAFPIQ